MHCSYKCWLHVARTCCLQCICLVVHHLAFSVVKVEIVCMLPQVTCSVIGRNCHIGRGVRMDGCYIQDNVRVGDGAQLTSAMVCEGAVIMHDAVVHPGSVISFQVSLS